MNHARTPDQRRELRIGIAGAGTMGCAVAAEFARIGYRIVLFDISSDAREDALRSVRTSLRTRMMLRNESSPDDIPSSLERLTISSDFSELCACDVIVENIVEDIVEKEQLYRRMAAHKDRFAAVIVNSSTVEIARAREWLDGLARVVGVHFMNPVAVIDTVEMITAPHTEPRALELVTQLLADIGKTAVLVEDSCGYVSNRVYMLTVNEAVRTLEEGVAPADAIDRIFRQCFGWKSGPLMTADLIGLDTVLNSLRALEDRLGGDRYEPALLLVAKVDEGCLGMKSGKGFYDYS